MDPARNRTIHAASASPRAMTAPDFTGWHEPWPLTRPLPQPKPVIVEML